MIGEVKQKLFDAEQCVSLGEHSKLGQLSDEPADLQLGLNVDLVLLPHMPPAVKQPVRGKYFDSQSGASILLYQPIKSEYWFVSTNQS